MNMDLAVNRNYICQHVDAGQDTLDSPKGGLTFRDVNSKALADDDVVSV